MPYFTGRLLSLGTFVLFLFVCFISVRKGCLFFCDTADGAVWCLSPCFQEVQRLGKVCTVRRSTRFMLW